MGEDKPFLNLNNKILIDHTISKVKKYLKELIIITNKENDFFVKNNLITVKDCIEGQLGPLVGILTAMKWAKENSPKCSWIASFPCDTPFFPESIILKFIEESKKKQSLILCASSHGRKHNIFGLWSLDLYDKLHNDLVNNKIRKVQDWTKANNIKNLEFKFKDYDPFFNINTLEDLEFAKKLSLKINEHKQ
jgi:molybdopterin-guanine dinucleotide biosynthesis protein A